MHPRARKHLGTTGTHIRWFTQGLLVQQPALPGALLQAVRNMGSTPLGVDKDKQEPAASPWIKVVSRPGDDPENRSEDPPPVKAPEGMSPTRTGDSDINNVPEKNPSMPQAPLDPEVVAASEANPSVDSVRYMAGKLNEAVGGEFDFPKTGGTTVREMASEIKDNIKEKVTGNKDA